MAVSYFCGAVEKKVHESQAKVSYRQLSQELLLLAVVTLQMFSNLFKSIQTRSNLFNTLAGHRNFAKSMKKEKQIKTANVHQRPPMLFADIVPLQRFKIQY